MLGNQGSRTARAVAIGRAAGITPRGGTTRSATAAAVGGHDLRDDVVAALLPARDRLAVTGLRALGRRRLLSLAAERLPVLAAAAHAPLRMHAVDAALGAAVAELDPDCVVVLGAGYDTRAWRLAALRGRRVVEVDHPATQAAKRARTTDLDPVAAAVELVPADLRDDALDTVLDGAGQDPSAPVVWVWEAVVPYLPPAAVDRTLAVLAARSPVGSRLLVTTMTSELIAPEQPAVAWSVELGLRALGEPVRTLEPDGAAVARLARHGWGSPGGVGPQAWAAAAQVDLVGPVLDERLHVAARVTGSA